MFKREHELAELMVSRGRKREGPQRERSSHANGRGGAFVVVAGGDAGARGEGGGERRRATIETEESVVDSGARASGLGLFRFPVGLTILADVSFN